MLCFASLSLCLEGFGLSRPSAFHVQMLNLGRSPGRMPLLGAAYLLLLGMLAAGKALLLEVLDTALGRDIGLARVGWDELEANWTLLGAL